MKCEKCGKIFERRPPYVYHLATCKGDIQRIEDEVTSSPETPVDDSDDDPCWTLPAEDYTISSDEEQPTSPLTAEQVKVAHRAEQLLHDELPSEFGRERTLSARPGSHHPIVSQIHTTQLPDKVSVEHPITQQEPLLYELKAVPPRSPYDIPTVPFIQSGLELEQELQTESYLPLPELTNIHATDSNIQQSTAVLSTNIETRTEHDFGLHTDVSKKHETDKRVWNRKDCCIFCEKMVTNFSRHLIRNHSNELQVSKALAYKKGAIERRRIFEQLKKKGNFHNNASCLREQKGTVVVVRRPTTNTNASHYLPCRLCFGYFSKSRLYRDLKECKFRLSNQNVTTKNAQSFASTLTMINDECSLELKSNIFTIMRNDEVTDIAKKDTLICAYGSRLIKTRKDKHMRTIISQKMRELARLLMNLKSKYPGNYTLQDFILPEHYSTVVLGVQELSGFNPLNGSFRVPSLATKLGHSLKTCADILQCVGIAKNDEKLEQSAKRFQIMMDKQWQYDISVNASKTLYREKYNKPVLLPIANDLKLLKSYIADKEVELAKNLKLNCTQELWRELSELVLAHLIILNRRRAGEAERIKVTDYVDRAKKEHNEDIFQSLTNVEKTLCHSLTRFETRGKRGRRVPVLLTPSMKDNIDILLDTREVVKVMPTNPYLFALPETEDSTLRGTTVLHKYATLCGAKNPETLTSTKLRKHIATMSQLLHLTPGDMEQLAGFMGHNLEIHKQYYRLPENTVQVAKMSKILLMVEKGLITDFNGKSIDELNVDFKNPVCDLSSGDEQEENEIQPPNLINQQEQLNVPVKELVYVNNLPSCSKDTSDLSEMLGTIDKKRRKTSKKVPWTEEEKNAILRHFQKHILLKKVPNKKECDSCLAVESSLSGRSWSHVKFCVKNMFKK